MNFAYVIITIIVNIMLALHTDAVIYALAGFCFCGGAVDMFDPERKEEQR